MFVSDHRVNLRMGLILDTVLEQHLNTFMCRDEGWREFEQCDLSYPYSTVYATQCGGYIMYRYAVQLVKQEGPMSTHTNRTDVMAGWL